MKHILRTHKKFFGKKKVFPLCSKMHYPPQSAKTNQNWCLRYLCQVLGDVWSPLSKWSLFQKCFVPKYINKMKKKAREEILHKMLSVSKKWLNTSESPFSIHFFASECSNAAVWKFYNFPVTYIHIHKYVLT